MTRIFTTRLSDSSFPILVLSYSILMMHYVFSRAFRDSLLGSRLPVSELPSLTFIGTLLAITISLVCSLFLRSTARIQVVRLFYLLNAVAETIIAIQYQNHSWMLRAYYIEVSASTAIGLSLLWVLVGDWTSNCNYGNTNKVPSVLISGTAAGMFAGFGLAHLPSATDFRASLLMLAVMDVCVSSLLLFHRDGSCVFRGRARFREFSGVRQNWSSAVVRMLAVVTLLGSCDVEPTRPRIPSKSCRSLQLTGPEDSLHGIAARVPLPRRPAFAVWRPATYRRSMGEALPHPLSRDLDGSRTSKRARAGLSRI